MYAADRSTLVGSLPEKAPPPCGAIPPYVSTMILRPVRPVSALGPPISKRPVGLTSTRTPSVESSWNSRSTGSITSASMSGRSSVSTSTSSRCCAEIKTVSTRTGLPSTYSIDTWLLPSGRRYGTTPALRTSDSRLDRRWAIAIGIGISSSVSRQAEPNIMPLVAGTEMIEVVARMILSLLERVVDADGDVGRLLLDRGHHPARLAVKPELGVGVADLGDRATHDRRDVDPALRERDLARDEHDAGGDERLAHDAAVRVLSQHRIEDRVADLVRELVGMAFRDGFRREEVARGHDRPSVPAPTDARHDARGGRSTGPQRGPRPPRRAPSWSTSATRHRLPPPR